MITTLEEGLQEISRMDPGGNAPNEIRNLVCLMEGGVGPEHVALYTSSDALFESWLASLHPAVRERVSVTRLNLESRMGVHFRYAGIEEGKGHKNGTLAISSPAGTTREAVRQHFSSLLACRNLTVSEGLGREILATALPRKKELIQKMNPSSALRSDCAIDAYEYAQAGGFPPLATMNNEEADFYIRVLKGRVENESPEKFDPFFFPSPFSAGGSINDAAVETASGGFREYFHHIPPPHSEKLFFPLSVSCGKEGGYHVATVRGKRYVVFTTTPHRSGAEQLLRHAGNAEGLSVATARSMGAGDAVGTVLSLVNNVWDVEGLLRGYAKSGGEYSLDENYLRAASIIFVGMLSRFLGEYVFHSERTDITALPRDRIRPLVESAAVEALRAAAPVWKVGLVPKASLVQDLGIQIAFWELTEERRFPFHQRWFSLPSWLTRPFRPRRG